MQLKFKTEERIYKIIFSIDYNLYVFNLRCLAVVIGFPCKPQRSA